MALSPLQPSHTPRSSIPVSSIIEQLAYLISHIVYLTASSVRLYGCHSPMGPKGMRTPRFSLPQVRSGQDLTCLSCLRLRSPTSSPRSSSLTSSLTPTRRALRTSSAFPVSRTTSRSFLHDLTDIVADITHPQLCLRPFRTPRPLAGPQLGPQSWLKLILQVLRRPCRDGPHGAG
jgi:hypothetical protein